jgi:dienelactone hydrolase
MSADRGARKGASGEHLARRGHVAARHTTSAFVVDADRAVRGGRRLDVHFDEGGERVPGILILPLEPRPAPAALLLHGYSSNKERMADSAGRALLAHGIASLAIDFPLHGARVRTGTAAGLPPDEWRNPLRLAQRWRGTLVECRSALRHLRDAPEVDSTRIALVGYSMGAYLGLDVAAADPAVHVVVLAAGGDLPAELPLAPLVRRFVDPLKSVKRLRGRPLLMVNGRHDRTITAAQAERLHAAAEEPKSMLWYDGGHWLPDSAVRQAITWLAERL